MNPLLEKLKRHAVRIGLGIAVLIVFLLHASDDPGGPFRWSFIDEMENLTYDARLVFSMPRTIDPRIVIVDIDEKSLGVEGRWPWSRDRLSTMLTQLFEKYKVSLVGFDVVFAEPDDSSGLKVLEQLAGTEFKSDPSFQQRLQVLKPSLDNDARFAATIKKYPVVLGYYFNAPDPHKPSTVSGELPPPTFVKGTFQGRRVDFIQAAGYGANLAEFEDAAIGAGHFNPWVDQDGVVRRVPMLYDYKGAYYESLSLMMARTYMKVAELRPRFETAPWGGAKNYSGFESIQVGRTLVPVDERVRTLVPYRGPQGSFHYVSATDVIHGKADPTILKPGTIVLVGTTAPGLLDLRSTPVQNAFAGVEIHANLISAILDGRLLQKPAYTKGAEFVLLLLFGLVMVFLLPVLSPLAATAAATIFLCFYIALNLLIWHTGHLVLPLASGIIMMLVMFLLNMSYGFFVETRGKRQLTGLFGQYVPPELVDEMSRAPDQYSLEAESREMTVLFSDVRGFTTISEGLNPKQLAELMNQLLTPMTHIIHDNRGTIDKYMGDAIMAFWGAPLPDPDHARHAITAAMEMLAKLPQINADFKKKGWPPVKIGVGINTGSMNVGNMGSEFRMAYTVLGDSVNLGSRLEGLTKTYGVYLIVSETTKAAVPELAYRELDIVRVKGKDKPVAIYEPLGHAATLDKSVQDELKIYRQALKYYRAQQWDLAELQFLNLAKMSASPALYKMYAERIAHFRGNPPEKDWDGVFTHTAK